MSYQNENFGMMDEGYFVPRTEILEWLNNLLRLNLTKIQQLGSGAVYCQVLDVIHPGKVSLSKLNWKARNDYQFINNLKVLQNAFDKIGIKKHLQIERLAKAKYQDNLELIQWLKRYYDLNCGQRGNNYLPEERRGNVIVDFSFADKNVVPKTYGGMGSVKNQPAQKKKTVKQEEPPAKIKSPQTKKTRAMSPMIKQKATTSTTVSAQPTHKKSQDVIDQANADNNEEDSEELITQLKNQYEQKINSLYQEQEMLKNQFMGYKESVKHIQMKIQMMKEILRGEDDATMKLSLIEEIIND